MPPVERLSITRLLLHLWIILWVTTIPLFHTHRPDATDAWSLLHSGGAHSVVSPDLPGEFSHPFSCAQYDCSVHVSQRAINSPEIGLAIITEESDDRKASGFLGISSHLTSLSRPAHVRAPIERQETVDPAQHSPPQSAPRAPPLHATVTV